MVTLSQALRLIGGYARDRLLAQMKAVAPITLYLILFQVWVLGVPVAEAGVIAAGLGLVVVGLAFFMEGLLLGLMPLGETIGLKLPQRAGLTLMLGFAFLLGVGSTFAEPAIGVLRAAGASIRPWEAPLLFLMLNDYADWLVYSVGLGVGVAVLFGMLRFLYQWSLKPFIYLLAGATGGLTVYCYLDPQLIAITGLAWDSGAVTTGPVTVPLVLALGIGVSRVVGGGDGESQGFGVVTLASLFPVLAVLLLGLALSSRAPAPMDERGFFQPAQRAQALALFGGDPVRLFGYGLRHASADAQAVMLPGGEPALLAELGRVAADPALRARAFGDDFGAWLSGAASPSQRAAVAAAGVRPEAMVVTGPWRALAERLLPNARLALQAILPLVLFLVLVLKLLLRFRLPRVDELALGVGFAVVGMSLFNLGIELGLSKLGNQVGGKLPAAYAAIDLPEAARTLPGFDAGLVQRAVGPDGQPAEFFFLSDGGAVQAVPFVPERLREGVYRHLPKLGPLFSGDRALWLGLALVLGFAFVTGYAATLAEPALNALGITVERVTGGSFRKAALMQAVALGVGVGLLLGVVKIVWDLPLMWLLLPPYLVLLLITALSGEEFVNIGWDAAGVTTGPITVPLVLALGLGIGGQAGVVEGFGILAMASVCPIISVLGFGLYVTWRHRRELALNHPAEVVAPVQEQGA